MTRNQTIAQVVFPIPVDRPFDYAIPSPLAEKVGVGKRVRVPFGRAWEVGYVVGLLAKSKLPRKAIKPIGEVIDETSLLDDRLLELSKKIRDGYLCPWGEVLEMILPVSLRARQNRESFSGRWEGSLEEPPPLPEDEGNALKKIRASLDIGGREKFLLVGELGTDPMEVILQAVHQASSNALSSIVLFPELARVHEAMGHFRRRFGDRTVALHGQLSPLHRYEIWKTLQSPGPHVVLGVRSALFSPVQNLGLIVCFGENSRNYKQEESPRLHARQIALFRSSLEGATVIFESQTPSLESFNEAEQGRYTLLRLHRHPERKLPKVSVVDMRDELRLGRRKVLFSRELERKIREALEKKEQVLLFLNRRGFATSVHCRQCGATLRCPDCQVSFKYHSEKKKLLCHYCHTEEAAPEICPACRAGYLQYTGAGTERAESELSRIFPGARIARLDKDAAKGKGALGDILRDFHEGKIDLLIGTQMVAWKIFPKKALLVGVVSADSLLNRPDFRSAEEAYAILFHLVSQAMGGEGVGEIILQTFSPDHHVIRSLSARDTTLFYEEEMRLRRELGFPPFGFLAKVTLSGKNEETVLSKTRSFQKALGRLKSKGITFLGPAPEFGPRRKGETRRHFLVRAEKPILAEALKRRCARFEGGSVKLLVDIDPV